MAKTSTGPETDSPKRSVSEIVDARLSVRAFLADPVDADIVSDILIRAARAPSGGNLQPWTVHIVQGQTLTALKTAMAKLCFDRPDGDPMPTPFYPATLSPAHMARRIENGARLYAALGIDRDDKAARKAWIDENVQFFGAPLGLFFLMHRDFGPYQWLDLGIYMQTVMLLLGEAGLDTCPQADWAMYAPTIEAMLGLPSSLTLICGMAVGYRDESAPINQVRTMRASPFFPNGEA
ncbi:nitroreductase [Acidisoma silvae]|uniref:Nitroreductase n=1 Tax=Acidisoma silvae TaxID=2802396 RepID=A0A964E0V4_9PROT|nr:nitroreductase [Acidisoma silvae]MCB8877544.1 nitroreductase [Acidisoma silvae]